MKQFKFLAMLLFIAFGMTACSSSDKDDDKPDAGEVDTRLESVVPSEYRAQLSKYMPIYDGVNPPNVEGVYLASPATLVFASDGGYDPGHNFEDYYYKFSNQNTKKNTVDYIKRNIDNSFNESSTGAFVSGEGNNFTIFFNATGVASGISIKNASLVSGTMSAEGIKNLIWAFVMTEKGDDPENKLMKVGAFRVIKDNDGLAENTAWPSATRAFEPVFDFSENSKGIQN